jgi:Ca2+-binding EF-hand superfamily protein
MHECKDG